MYDSSTVQYAAEQELSQASFCPRQFSPKVSAQAAMDDDFKAISDQFDHQEEFKIEETKDFKPRAQPQTDRQIFGAQSTYAMLKNLKLKALEKPQTTFQLLNTNQFLRQVPPPDGQKYSLASFESMEVVGEGTYGKVYKAEVKSDSMSQTNIQGGDMALKYRALKLLKLCSEEDGWPITNLREILILKRLSHPNVVSLLDVFTHNKKGSDAAQALGVRSQEKQSWRQNSIYLVFEFVPHDLTGLMDYKLRWSAAQLKCILKQILEGLEYLHKNKCLHRDLKGSNILVSQQGLVKLCDFGLAKQIDTAKQRHLTTTVVTRWYRAPELFLGDRSYTDKIDVWSVGCIFAELLTESKSPFRGGSDDETFKLIAQRCPFPTKEEWPELRLMPNYNAYLRSMYPHHRGPAIAPPNMQSPAISSLSDASTVNSPQLNVKENYFGASLIDGFLDKYGYLWAGVPCQNQKVGSNLSPAFSETSPDTSSRQTNGAFLREKEDLKNICKAMLTVNSKQRPSVTELLNSDFFTKNEPRPCQPSELLGHLPDLPLQLNEQFMRKRSQIAKRR